MLVPPDHVSRSQNDTYYVDSEHVLRCHTSAHQLEMLKDGATKFLVTGDVYRRDSIDATHFPVFHQMVGTERGGGDRRLLCISSGAYRLTHSGDMGQHESSCVNDYR